jgi:EF hand
MTFKLLLLSACALAFAGPAFAQQTQTAPMAEQAKPQRQGPFERLDANNDGVITLEEVRQFRTASFNRLDTNRDGFLSQDELAAARNRAERGGGGPDGRREGRSGGMGLASADTNRDGAVSRAEFDAMIANAQAQRARQAGAMRDQRFLALDTNRDGSLSSAEIAAARANRESKKGPDQGAAGPQNGRPPPRNFAMLDTNNDQRVSLAEWLAAPEPLFERADLNKDGRVTREEAASAMRQGRGGDGRPTRPW